MVVCKAVSCPVISMGDFNMEADELFHAGLLTFLDLVVLKPQQVTTTNNRGHTIIDYVLASSSVSQIISPVLPVFDVPWKTHIAIEFSIFTDPVEVQSLKLIAPSLFLLQNL